MALQANIPPADIDCTEFGNAPGPQSGPDFIIHCQECTYCQGKFPDPYSEAMVETQTR